MAGDSKKLQPIIIKRVRKGGHGKHGGAWKIAYADFVTAMMAFFLLMWLLGSTTEGDKKGIADFFNAPLKVSLMGGSGSGDSSSVVRGGGADLTRSTGQVKDGDTQAKKRVLSLKALQAEQRRAEQARLEALKARVEAAVNANPKLASMKSQIRMDMTPDGLRIQIVDEQNRPMFDSGSAIVKPYMRELLREIGHMLNDVPNRITLEGHTDAQPFSGGERGYSNWELSSDRANSSRREIVAGGLPEDRMLLVQGLASSKLFVPAQPEHPMNRRISVIVMNREAEDRLLKLLPNQGEAESAPPIGADSDETAVIRSRPLSRQHPRAAAADRAASLPSIRRDCSIAMAPLASIASDRASGVNFYAPSALPRCSRLRRPSPGAAARNARPSPALSGSSFRGPPGTIVRSRPRHGRHLRSGQEPSRIAAQARQGAGGGPGRAFPRPRPFRGDRRRQRRSWSSPRRSSPPP